MLHMAPGMHVHMCHDDGEGRLRAAFDDLERLGEVLPLAVAVSKVNVTLSNGLVVYVKYLAESEPEWPLEGMWREDA
jgi:hypothetical protein